jgi:hypothetical protein
MPRGWRARGGAIGASILACLLLGGATLGHAPGHVLTVRDEAGADLAQLALPADGAFTLRYRNSVYGSTAEERFVADGAAFRLVALAAREVAVLDEYYELAGGPRRGGRLGWVGAPEQRVVLETLRVAATDLGRRTLVVEGSAPLALWKLAADEAPTVVLTIEPPP